MKVENLGSHKIWSTFEYQIPIEFGLKKRCKQTLISEGGNNFTWDEGLQIFLNPGQNSVGWGP